MGQASMRRRCALGLLGASAAALLTRPLSAKGAPLIVFAAASLKSALDEIAGLWSARGGAPLRLSYGASSALARQIELGAPAHLFVSAHPLWTAYLIEAEALVAESRVDVAANRLALVAAEGRALALQTRRAEGGGLGEIDGSLTLASALGEDRLATGRTDSVPLGIYARQALEALGLWAQVERRLVEAQNARIALAYVARGEAPLGVLYASDLGFSSALRPVGLFPRESHAPILYPAALTKDGAEALEAAEFLRYLASAEASEVFVRLGFEAPAQDPALTPQDPALTPQDASFWSSPAARVSHGGPPA